MPLNKTTRRRSVCVRLPAVTFPVYSSLRSALRFTTGLFSVEGPVLIFSHRLETVLSERRLFWALGGMAGAACEGNGMSDERIGEAVIKEVFVEELKDVPSDDVPPLTPLTSGVQSTQEKKIVTELAKMIRIIGDSVKDNRPLQDAIDGMRRTPGKWDLFKKVADDVFEQGITWERIAVLFYVAGRLAVKLVEAHLPQSVREILQWTVDFFRTNLLGWIREHGGWISSFPALASASIRTVGGWQLYGVVLVFVAGLALGSLFTARLLSRP